MEQHKPLKNLTPHEQARTEKNAYQGWLQRVSIYNPAPTPDSGDLINENRRVMEVLTNLIGYLPVLMGIVLAGAIIVSVDKTAKAFEASVAHQDGLWGIWMWVVVVAAIIMVDGALVVTEFALVRDMLSKGLKRQVFTIKSMTRRVRVFMGTEEPLDYHQMPDQTLAFYSKFLFWLIVAANVYGVTKASGINGLGDLTFENGLLLFTGVAGALSLRMVGRQVAHIVYELAKKRQDVETHEMREEWRKEVTQAWIDEGPRLIAQALHDSFLRKNKLSVDASVRSPYLLLAGENENGEAAVDAVPFVRSSEPSSMNLLHDLDRNGRH